MNENNLKIKCRHNKSDDDIIMIIYKNRSQLFCNELTSDRFYKIFCRHTGSKCQYIDRYNRDESNSYNYI